MTDIAIVRGLAQLIQTYATKVTRVERHLLNLALAVQTRDDIDILDAACVQAGKRGKTYIGYALYLCASPTTFGATARCIRDRLGVPAEVLEAFAALHGVPWEAET